MTPFMLRDRAHAAKLLTDLLKAYKGTDTIILAIPRGGVPIGYEIAKALELPLEIVLAKKIGHPSNPEYAIGAVTPDDTFLDEEARHIAPEYIREETRRLKIELESRLNRFMPGRKLTSLKAKNVIIVDDGIATGRTLIACIKSIKRKNPARVIIAAGVASAHAAAVLKPLVDDFICPHAAPDFHAVGQFYLNFPQVGDQEVIKMLQEARSYRTET